MQIHLAKNSGEEVSSRRTTVDIYADILEVVRHNGSRGRVTKISYGVGMPVDRLKRFLGKLEKFGLVRSDVGEEDQGSTYTVTPRGQEFLEMYWRMKAYLDIFQDESA